jgi:hypothetical protein
VFLRRSDVKEKTFGICEERRSLTLKNWRYRSSLPRAGGSGVVPVAACWFGDDVVRLVFLKPGRLHCYLCLFVTVCSSQFIHLSIFVRVLLGQRNVCWRRGGDDGGRWRYCRLCVAGILLVRCCYICYLKI